MKFLKLVLFTPFVGLLFMISCTYIWQQGQFLDDGYFYMPQYEAIDVGFPYGSAIYKSDRINHFSKDCILMNGGIIDVNHNDSFILVGQNRSQTDNETEKDVAYFWVVVKNTSDVYGPMSFEQYLAKKKELGVPDRLRLKYEKDKVKK